MRHALYALYHKFTSAISPVIYDNQETQNTVGITKTCNITDELN